MSGATSERALVLAPRGRDAAIAQAMLAEADIDACPCASLSALVEALNEGAGFALVTEEALATTDLHALSGWIAGQEEWSDLPFILLTTRGGGLERNPSAARYLGLLGNVTFLERPFHPTTLVSLAQSALRGRRRQYDARARLHEVREGAERYRSLFESIDAGFCIVEVIYDGERPSDFKFIEVNPAFERQTGARNVVGRRVTEFTPELEQHWFDTYGNVASTGESVRFERRAEDDGRWFDVHAFRVGPAAARRVAVLFNDISARRQVEQELRELTASLEQRVDAATRERSEALAQLHEVQKLEMIGQLTGGVAHDFNNLLMPITGALDLIYRRFGSEDERTGRLIGGAMESAERARTLVQRLLGFARRQALQTRAVDMTVLLEGMLDLVTSSVGPTVEVRLACGAALPAAMVDPNQFELALLNLCVNARDAMPSGGQLTISAEAEGLAPGTVPGLAPGAYLRVSVIDTGTGMDDATLGRAIEPFYSTKELGKGTGLGLSMVHGLVSQLGGGVRLTSALGEGTRVDLWLPIADAAAAQAMPTDAEPEAPTSAGRSVTILLVDDEPLVRSATAEMLRELDHRVIEAATAAEALEQLKIATVDVVVTDYMMPRMTGAELAERIWADHAGVPVLLITGYARTADEVSDLPRLDKPFRRAELARAIQQLTARDHQLGR